MSPKEQNLSQSQVSQSSWRSAMLTPCRAWVCEVGGIPLSSELLWPSVCTAVMFQPWYSLLVANKMCIILFIETNKQTQQVTTPKLSIFLAVLYIRRTRRWLLKTSQCVHATCKCSQCSAPRWSHRNKQKAGTEIPMSRHLLDVYLLDVGVRLDLLE